MYYTTHTHSVLVASTELLEKPCQRVRPLCVAINMIVTPKRCLNSFLGGNVLLSGHPLAGQLKCMQEGHEEYFNTNDGDTSRG